MNEIIHFLYSSQLFLYLQKTYWCGYRLATDDPEAQPLLAGKVTVNSQYFETDPVGLPAGVVIKSLKKVSVV